MSKRVRFEWVRGNGPEVLIQGTRAYAQHIQQRAFQVAQEIALEAQNAMREGRPWRDITGNARRGLRVEVVKENDQIVMYFIHSAEYGIYLELSNGGRYAIIVPTIHQTIPKIQQRLKGLANG